MGKVEKNQKDCIHEDNDTYVVDKRHTNIVGSALNSLTISFLFSGFVSPSNLLNKTPQLIRYASMIVSNCKGINELRKLTSKAHTLRITFLKIRSKKLSVLSRGVEFNSYNNTNCIKYLILNVPIS